MMMMRIQDVDMYVKQTVRSAVFTVIHIYQQSFCQVCSLEDGRSLGPGEHGEIYIRGPLVMKGYVKKPQATRDAFDSKGWFKSGETR